MKLSSLLMGAFALVAAHTLVADEATDALWQKVEDAMNGIKKPAKRPASREEAMELFKKGITVFDAAESDFVTKAPSDPRRWKARLFEAQTLTTREALGMDAKGNMSAILGEIQKAPDADAETKGDASFLLVMAGAKGIESGKGDVAAWTKAADEHLKTYPDHKFNATIQSAKKKMETLAALKEKPLDIKFTAVDGTEVDLAKMRGKVVLIDFWATWCGPCVGEVPNVVKTYEKLHDKGFEIIGISLDSDKGKLESFVKDKKMTWPQYFDGKGWKNEISTKYGINSIPAMWLVDKKGMVVSTNVRGKLEAEVEKHLAE